MNSSFSYPPTRQFALLSVFFLLGVGAAAFFSLYWIAAIPFAFVCFYLGWQQWQIVFFILLMALPWSVEYNFTTSLGTDLPDEPLMLITALFFILHWFYNPSIISKSSWRHPLMICLLVHLLWITIAVIFSTDILLSLKYWLAKGWYLLAFVFTPVVLFKDKKNIRIAAGVFLFSVLLLTAIILYRHYKMGLSFEKINDAAAPFFRNHVNYSAMLICVVPLLIAVYQLNKNGRLIILAFLAMVFTAIFFSYARGAWIATLVGLLAYVLIHYRKLFVSYCMVLGIATLGVLWLKSNDRYLEFAHEYRTTIFHKDFKEHWAATYELKDVSTAERFNRWIAGIRMVPDRWVSGYGPNTFYDNYKPYAIPAFKTWVSKNEEHSTVHNYFLFLAIEQGIPGLVIFLILVGGILFYAEKIYHRTTDRFYKTAALTIGVMITMIMVVNFLSDLIETDKVGSLFFVCVGSLIAIDIKTYSKQKPVPSTND